MQELLFPVLQLWSRVVGLLVDPTSNLPAAFVLYGIIALILLIVLIVAIMFLIGGSDEDEIVEPLVPAPDDDTYEHFDSDEPTTLVAVPENPAGEAAPSEPVVQEPPARRNPRAPYIFVGVSVLVLALVWGVAGYTTSDSAVCMGCHGATSEHAKALAGSNRHDKTACVACHEGGGVFGRYFGKVPARAAHFADSQTGTRLQDDYGRVTTSACESCHRKALVGVATNKTRGLKMSHKEPLAASATCLDCHELKGGVVGSYNAGMGPCMRCHDSKQASAKCTTCHDVNAASAARARTTTFTAEQIPDLKCGGCHNEKRDCDGCHGLRMPHSREFMGYAHSRSAAVDIWYNGGRGCAKCHTATRRPCTKCHSGIMGHAHGGGSAMASTHKRATSVGCDTCHQQFAYMSTRDFCKDICHSPAAVAASPR